MGYTADALAGLAQILADAGVGVYRDSGAYDAAEVGIVIGTVPQNPPSVVCLIPYPLSDDPVSTDSVLGCQVRCRAASQDPREAMDLADAVFDVWQGLHEVNLSPTARLLIAERVTGVPLGEDSNGRPEWADSYQLTLNRPSLHRI